MAQEQFPPDMRRTTWQGRLCTAALFTQWITIYIGRKVVQELPFKELVFAGIKQQTSLPLNHPVINFKANNACFR